MRTSTVDIIQDLISNWTLTVQIKSIVDNEDGTYLLNVCETYYLTNQTKFSIDSVEYEVIEVVDNVSILIKGVYIPVVTSFILEPPHFFHGTVYQTNAELSLIADCFDKTPMVYLRRTFEETKYGIESSIDRESNLSFYFLTQSDFANWHTADIDKLALKPMQNMAFHFIDMLTNHKHIGVIKDYKQIDNIKFATYINEKGYQDQKFNDQLSGVQIDITLPIRRNYKCTC